LYNFNIFEKLITIIEILNQNKAIGNVEKNRFFITGLPCIKSVIYMKKVIVILIFFSTLSCVSNKEEDSTSSDFNKKVQNTKYENLKNQEFENYWKEFHLSISENNFDLLEELVSFPIIINGFEDTDPIILIKKDSFKLIFDKFLSQPLLFYNDDFISHKQFIESTPDIIFLKEYKEYNKNDNWIRIENLVFEKNENVWELKEIYMDTKN
jgi:hypothetical protein